jgi:hypothetical protein
MNLSDAMEDYFRDVEAGRDTPLPTNNGVPDVKRLESELRLVLTDLDRLVRRLPLKRNFELVEMLVIVHARARAERTLTEFRTKIQARVSDDTC